MPKEKTFYDPETAPIKHCSICGKRLAGYNLGTKCLSKCTPLSMPPLDRSEPSPDLLKNKEVDTSIYPYDLILTVCNVYDISFAELRGAWGSRILTEARHVAVYLLCMDGLLLKKAIGEATNPGGRTATDYAFSRISERRNRNRELDMRIQQIQRLRPKPPTREP